mgnify:CR=1 FL=1
MCRRHDGSQGAPARQGHGWPHGRVSGNAKGLRQSPLRGELVSILEMVLGHELPEALRELLVVPGADGGRQGCLFEHLKPFLLIGKTKMSDCSFLVNDFESIKPMG